MNSNALIERLKLRLDPGADEPLSSQLVELIWLDVVDGTIPTGARLPTVRQLAIAAGLSPRSVERAYAELGRLGVTATRRGEGTFVSLSLPSEEERSRRTEFARLCRETLDRSRTLGYSLEDLLEALVEFRSSSGPPGSEPEDEQED